MTTTMHPPVQPVASADLDLATETLYRFFSAALSDPRRTSHAIVRDHASQELACGAAELLRSAEELIPLGFGESPAEDLELTSVLAQLPADADGLADEYVRVFGLATCRECPPYETEFLTADDPFFRAQQMADIAGFYRAFGLTPGAEGRERPDFLGLELEFAAYLLMRQRMAATDELAAICRHARQVFVRDHLSWWTPSFALAVRRKAETGFYEGVGRALAALLPIERRRLDIPAPKMPLVANVSETPDPCQGCLAATGA
jgi:TorA maturation chaperone TorD